MPDEEAYLPTNLLTLVLCGIDHRRQRGWYLKKDIVRVIGEAPRGQYLAERTLRRMLGVDSNGNLARCLDELVRDRVLIQLAEPRGSRSGAYMVNAAVGDWRRVPWRRERDRVLSDLLLSLFHEEPPTGDNSRRCRPLYATGHNGGVLARDVQRATTPTVVARHMQRATTPTVVARDMQRARTADVVARSMQRATTEGGAPKEVPFSSSDDSTSSSGWGREEEGGGAAQGSGSDSTELIALGRAALQFGPGRFCSGPPRETLRALLADGFTVAEIVATMRLEAKGDGVPNLVARVAGALHLARLGVDLDEDAPDEDQGDDEDQHAPRPQYHQLYEQEPEEPVDPDAVAAAKAAALAQVPGRRSAPISATERTRATLAAAFPVYDTTDGGGGPVKCPNPECDGHADWEAAWLHPGGSISCTTCDQQYLPPDDLPAVG